MIVRMTIVSDAPSCGVDRLMTLGKAYLMIIIYSLIVLATRSYCHYNRKTFIVQATGSSGVGY
jgi:hypothetical protein